MANLKTILKIAVGLLAGGACNGWAQYNLSWFTVDGGGGLTTNGGWVLEGTIGQPDSGPVMTGGTFQLIGGFMIVKAKTTKLGDLNCDNAVNFADINPFVLALSNPEEYKRQFPDCNINNADCNGDGKVDFGDINPFVTLLSGER